MCTLRATSSRAELRRPVLLRRVAYVVLLTWMLIGVSCGNRAHTRSPTKPSDQPAMASEGEVTVELDEAQEENLRLQAQADLEETEAILRRLDRENLSAEKLEKLQSVEELLLAARTAGQKDDVTAMANLARKARLLAEELVPG